MTSWTFNVGNSYRWWLKARWRWWKRKRKIKEKKSEKEAEGHVTMRFKHAESSGYTPSGKRKKKKSGMVTHWDAIFKICKHSRNIKKSVWHGLMLHRTEVNNVGNAWCYKRRVLRCSLHNISRTVVSTCGSHLNNWNFNRNYYTKTVWIFIGR